MVFQAIYPYGVATVLVLALLMFVTLFFITAPYGRHRRTGWGPGVNPRIGWILMELPSVVLFAWVYFDGVGAGQPAAMALFTLWELHYVQRTFIYPGLMRSGATPIPVSMAAMGWIFNAINALLNATALTHLPMGYSDRWLADPRFLIGAAVFLAGFTINVHSDHILRNLRKPGETGYKIPHGGLFRWVTSPNYFGEILEWCSWAVASWSLAGAAFAVFTFANLAPRARAHRRWYLENFPDYPKKRKALIPGVF